MLGVRGGGSPSVPWQRSRCVAARAQHLDVRVLFAPQVCCATWMTPASATPATRAPTATPTPSTAKPSARVPRGTWGRPATRTWTSARWVSALCQPLMQQRRELAAAGSTSWKQFLRFAGANPCEHAGKCINTQGSFQCQCLQGYSGPRCEIDVNECLSNPCQNDATCLDQIGEFQCICMPGMWAGSSVAPVCVAPLGAGCRQGKAPGAREQQLSIDLHSEPGVGALKRNVLCSAQHPIAMGAGERGAGHHQPSTPVLLPTFLA